MIRVVHFTDVHFGAVNVEAVAAAAAFAHAANPTAVLITGDITQRGQWPEFRDAAKWIAGLPEPRLCCPGNHDTAYYNVPLRILAPWARFDATLGADWKKGIRQPGLAVESINTARGIQLRTNWSKGKIDLGQARAAAARLTAAPAGDLRVVALHHPLLEVVGEPITSEVREGSQAVDIFAQAEVDLVLSGHLHVPFATPLPSGDRRTYTIGGGTLSLRERGTPASFNDIEADEAEIRVRAMSWRGGEFRVERSWTFPRRGAVAEAAQAV